MDRLPKDTNLVWAKRWTDAHEETPNNPQVSKEMDIYNNDNGIKIVHKNAGTTYAEIIQSCIGLIKDGELRVIHNGEIQPTTLKEFSIQSIFDAIEKRVESLIDYYLTYQMNETKQVNSEKEGALHFCVRENYLHGIREILLKGGANVKYKRKMNDNETPLMVAAVYRRIEMVKSLIASGADKNLESTSGWTAKEKAKNEGYLEIVKLLS